MTALQPPQAAAVQPAETTPTLQPPNATESQPLAADTDRQVRLFLLKWADAEKSTNIDDVGDFYAPKMSRYFTKRGVTRANVRAARAQDYARYGKMIVCDIKSISVNLVDSEHAVATFRKRWQTAGPRVWMGEEQEQLTLIRESGKSAGRKGPNCIGCGKSITTPYRAERLAQPNDCGMRFARSREAT
jgi:hypothetical protein